MQTRSKTKMFTEEVGYQPLPELNAVKRTTYSLPKSQHRADRGALC